MRRWAAWLGPVALLGMVAADAQTTMDEAREEGRTLAQAKRSDPALVPTDPARASSVPGYGGTDLPETVLLDDPDQLVAQGAATAAASDTYLTVTDPDHHRPTFDAEQIRTVTTRARAIETTPEDFLGGETITSSSAGCVPLPSSPGSAGSYEATCNSGTKVTETAPVCRVPLVVEVATRIQWQYRCVSDTGGGGNDLCAPFDPFIETGRCRVTASKRLPGPCLQGTPEHCTEPGPPRVERTLLCSEQVAGQSGEPVAALVVVAERRDEAACQAATSGQTCELAAETCVDAEPQTRIVDGLPVTRTCWGWQRSYSCHGFSAADDCAPLAGNAACH